MPNQNPRGENAAFDSVEKLLSEFNDELHLGTIPAFEPFLRRCAGESQRELCSLMNTLVLADRALRSLYGANDEVSEDKSEI